MSAIGVARTTTQAAEAVNEWSGKTVTPIILDICRRVSLVALGGLLARLSPFLVALRDVVSSGSGCT